VFGASDTSEEGVSHEETDKVLYSCKDRVLAADATAGLLPPAFEELDSGVASIPTLGEDMLPDSVSSVLLDRAVILPRNGVLLSA